MKRLLPAAPLLSLAGVTSVQGVADHVASSLRVQGLPPTRVRMPGLRDRWTGGPVEVLATGEVLSRASRLLKGDAERTLHEDVPPGRGGVVDAGCGGDIVQEDGRGHHRDDAGRGRDGR